MLIRQAAFRGNGKLLKGNLHCHTTRSDGNGTPKEVMRMYKAEDFDFLAITEHRTYYLKNFLDDDGLLIIP
ncbi:MAG: PHP domain-containing protein, partial [Oscillospiraceae bacterium]|nr:PHP domain-containing protein [Oscillospiraceae bacterium]